MIRMQQTKKKNKRGEMIFAGLFLLPWLVDIAVFKIYPFLYGVFISFFDVSYKSNTFVGIKNYLTTFNQPLFWNALAATLKICAVTIPVIVVGALLLSFILRGRSKKFKSAAKIILYLPAVTSEIVLAIVWRNMFSSTFGVSATICAWLGIEPIHWLSDIRLTIPLVGILVASLCIAQPVILLSTAIDNIDPSILEAAEMDGATPSQLLWHITLPSIMPTVSFVLITTTIGNLQVFYVPFLLTGGGPENKTVTVLYLIYKNAFEYGKYGIADAQGMVLFILIGIMVLAQYKLTKAGKIR